jgi:hypothetical protein
MVFTAAGLVNEAEIEAAVRKVEKDFAPDVVRIGHEFTENQWGDPSVRFRILIQDEVAAPITRLAQLNRRISVGLMNEARVFENGLEPSFSYRTVSEQTKLQDPTWG